MKIDIGTFMFNMNLANGSGTPSWGSELGQGKEHKLNDKIDEEFAKSLLFNAIDDKNNIDIKLGKGGGRKDDYSFVISSLFKKIFINGVPIPNAEFMLVIVKLLNGNTENHIGRMTIKYSDSVKYKGKEINKDCIYKMRKVLNIAEEGSWFVYEINTKNQDELHFSAIVLDKDHNTTFYDTQDRKNKVLSLIPDEEIESHDLCSAEVSIFEIGDDAGLCGYNKIYYGIPGCGKSWYIENNVLSNVDKKNDVFRTTFYLDYSNSDFVGQIYPKVNSKGDVSYEYVPGPFTKALERALTNPDKMIYLVIEEINRGNAAAIFGDLFQLLDRLKEDKDGRVKGDSEYPISNQFIEGYFEKRNNSKNCYDSKILFDEGNIYIPHNLTLLATMNTSDQNVYPLDTAFQRRWDREKIITDVNGTKYAELYVPGTGIKWKHFASKINIRMMEDCEDGSITEDKNLGAYFATDEMLCTEAENKDANIVRKKAIRFANNVMEYLFNTAVKFNPEVLFAEGYTRFHKIYDAIDEFDFEYDRSMEFIKLLAKNVAHDLEENLENSEEVEDD
ncbi:MAG: AAA family ATPase [Bacillota bacterium]|nr:AAA family ATPase [Bacillota bacterium]